MDILTNAVSSGLPEENFPGENMEGGDGVSLEWLSMFVEECLNGGFPNTTTTTATINPPIISEQSKTPKPPSKMRTKRRKLSPQANNSFHVTNTNSADSTLLPQTYWLAESELIFPKKENEAPKLAKEEEEEKALPEVEVVEIISSKEQPRRCTHCLSQKTPQWRAGPLGPKTLCNACGVRFKSGRLLPEYRPAKSPTFQSYKHSNSHKKVMEMRMAILSSHTN